MAKSLILCALVYERHDRYVIMAGEVVKQSDLSSPYEKSVMASGEHSKYSTSSYPGTIRPDQGLIHSSFDHDHRFPRTSLRFPQQSDPHLVGLLRCLKLCFAYIYLVQTRTITHSLSSLSPHLAPFSHLTARLPPLFVWSSLCCHLPLCLTYTLIPFFFVATRTSSCARGFQVTQKTSTCCKYLSSQQTVPYLTFLLQAVRRLHRSY